MRIKWDQFCSCTSCKSHLNHERHWSLEISSFSRDLWSLGVPIIPCSLFNGAVAIRAKTSKRKRVSKTSRARTVCGNIHMWKNIMNHKKWIITQFQKTMTWPEESCFWRMVGFKHVSHPQHGSFWTCQTSLQNGQVPLGTVSLRIAISGYVSKSPIH